MRFMRVKIGPTSLNCHFFVADEIKRDLNPSQVSSKEALQCLADFMKAIGIALSKDILLTEENVPHCIWIRFNAASREFETFNDA